MLLEGRLDLEAIKVGINYPDGQSEDLHSGRLDERAPSSVLDSCPIAHLPS
jgi:hypothetical protein